MTEYLKNRLSNVPKAAGIYLWKDKDNQIIYVGKAKNLNRRMHQYFEGAINSYKTNALVERISDFDLFICRNDKEALLLEKQYIEKYNPEYNILLLDDKRYPYIKIELKPHDLDISIVRKIKKKENSNLIYFGPFPQGYGAGVILKLLQREAFFENGLRIQTKDIEFWKQKFNHIKSIITFQQKYIAQLKEKMFAASANLQFEIALDIKNSLQYLDKIGQDQIIELKKFQNIDVFCYKIVQDTLYATILFYRHGNLIGKDNIVIDMYIDEFETLSIFFRKYYLNKHVPESIVVNPELEQFNLENECSLNFTYPKIGNYKKILNIAQLNLDEFCANQNKYFINAEKKAFNMLKLLSKYTDGQIPHNIVAFDNSNFANTNPVGVAVVYTNGLKNKFYYRKFNHTEISSRQADVEYMKLSVHKYFQDLKNNVLPDLIIVDGGLAQIHEAKKILFDMNLDINVIGLVKNDYHRTSKLIDLQEQIRSIQPLDLKNFLTEIQVEVDRFAKSHHRKRAKISSLEGKLQRIKGLGPNYENKLLKYFKTYNNIYNAPIEELEKVVPKNIALKIFNKEYL
ncbi:GIY-YIG nuclease family protein [Mycoplasma zalophidermidis]|uniref:GIY-YIG nuclease family protein n=1 Tax=Mycoplasma zalophidermidis TaxID=398174 RepID=A0ABS6DTG0_9MOLU|nr:GIY-YIG nuclease family protein [Mycoplasma zalophidermidis]MBU4689699.1 GIY-YIG nuclease family protein [Mycoplasma zalophidermidis]MBU4693905.1 GIY-YIG nuclease family protein [Mycoplasma zalophidermidis]